LPDSDTLILTKTSTTADMTHFCDATSYANDMH